MAFTNERLWRNGHLFVLLVFLTHNKGSYLAFAYKISWIFFETTKNPIASCYKIFYLPISVSSKRFLESSLSVLFVEAIGFRSNLIVSSTIVTRNGLPGNTGRLNRNLYTMLKFTEQPKHRGWLQKEKNSFAGGFVLIWMKQRLIWFNLQRDGTWNGLSNIFQGWSLKFIRWLGKIIMYITDWLV